MTFSPINSLGFYVPENITFSRDEQQFLLQLTTVYNQIAKALNSKDLGSYELTELLNGQRFFGANPQVKRGIYRKVVECGALPNAGATATAHGIAGIGNGWMFTRVYGMAREPAGVAPRPYFIPIPNSGAYQCELMVDTTNINIASALNLSAFTYSVVVLEYWKQ